MLLVVYCTRLSAHALWNLECYCIILVHTLKRKHKKPAKCVLLSKREHNLFIAHFSVHYVIYCTVFSVFDWSEVMWPAINSWYVYVVLQLFSSLCPRWLLSSGNWLGSKCWVRTQQRLSSLNVLWEASYWAVLSCCTLCLIPEYIPSSTYWRLRLTRINPYMY